MGFNKVKSFPCCCAHLLPLDIEKVKLALNFLFNQWTHWTFSFKHSMRDNVVRSQHQCWLESYSVFISTQCSLAVNRTNACSFCIKKPLLNCVGMCSQSIVDRRPVTACSHTSYQIVRHMQTFYKLCIHECFIQRRKMCSDVIRASLREQGRTLATLILTMLTTWSWKCPFTFVFLVNN